MGLTIIQEHLAPATQVTTYEVATRTLVRVPQGEMRYEGTTTVRHAVLAAGAAGYLIELTTLAQQQREPNELAELLLDIARANSPLHLATDAQGNFQRVTNKATLWAQWQQVQPWLTTKYQHLPGGAAMLAQVAGQYRDDNDHLEQALACKGSCGLLLPGIYGMRPVGGDARTSAKTLHQFFRAGSLPLQVAWTAHAPDALALTAEVSGTGTLDSARFDQASFQQALTQLLPAPPSRPAALRVQWQAQYTAGRAGQGLLAGRQWLRAVVPGVYEHETEHLLRPAPAPPAATPQP